MEYKDGAYTLFFYTKGTEGILSEAVRQLLHNMNSKAAGRAYSKKHLRKTVENL